MPTSASRIKLREARYFLNGMHQRNGVDRLDIGEEFGYFLSAFLSAARSISFVLREESPDSYLERQAGWLSSLDPASNDLCDEMKEHRNVALKEGALPATDSLRHVHWLSTAGTRSHHYRVIQPWMYDPGAQVGLIYFQIETAAGSEDAVEACTRYLAHVERLIALFE